MSIVDLLIYIFAILLIWIGSGLTVKGISTISNILRFPTFIVSFIILGAFTSLPEIFLVFKSTAEGTPEISAGNLIGGVAVIYFFLIPFIALISGGIKLTHEMNFVRLFLTVAVTILPFILFLDGHSSLTEAIILLMSYLILIVIVRASEFTHPLSYSSKLDTSEIIKNDLKIIYYLPMLIAGIVLIFISSNLIVEKTLDLAEFLQIPPFIVSLIVLSLGTNLPEVAIGIRSVLMKEKDVAIGGYLGSAVTNTWIFAVLSMINNGNLRVGSGTVFSALIFLIGSIIFFYFTNSKRYLSRNESFILLGIFLIFGLEQIL